jgi:nucleoside-diphosphate-sugar epimerase
LIVGCGFVGRATADLFHCAGWQVEGWTRSTESAAKLAAVPYPVRAVDISSADSVAAHNPTVDAVVDCVSSRGGGAEEYRRLYLDGTRNLLDHFDAARFVFTSSTSVYAQTDGSWVDETSPAEPQAETGRVLRETEDLVLARGGIVARLAGIYGPGRSYMVERFLSGDAITDADSDRHINLVHRDDVASALLVLVTSATLAAPRIFDVVDDQPMPLRDCYAWLAKKFNRPLPTSASPAEPRKRGTTNKRVSNRKLRALGWSPLYPNFADAMEKSILAELAGFR